MKKFYIKTFGCQMNVYDSSRIADLLIQDKYVLTENVEHADVVIVNTCHIREKAKEKIFSMLGKISIVKNKNMKKEKYMIVVVTGCVAQAEGGEIFKRMPIVDIVVGPGSYHKLPELVNQVFVEKQKENNFRKIELDLTVAEKFDKLPNIRETKGVSELVAVQEGCDKFCAYCVVPYTRGREYSRPSEQIFNEILLLRDKGVKEVILLGQNVDNYQYTDKKGNLLRLSDLIKKTAEISGIERIRYTTSYPTQVTQDLIDAHKDVQKLMPYIHLPIQSGSNKILKLMNRRYTTEQYLDVIEQVRKVRPDIAISSDFIVGFPDESDEDFEQTLDFVKKVNYAQAYSYKYSSRPGTAAAKRKNQVDEAIKQERLERLQELLNSHQLEFNKQHKDKTLSVLIEGISTKNKNTFFGRSPYLQSVTVPKSINQEIKVGDILDVEIIDVNMRNLRG